MNDNKDLKFIKKHYGEEFAKLCRNIFPTLLETPGLLSKLIYEHIEPTKSFIKDLKTEDNDEIDIEETLKNFIYSFIDVEKPRPVIIENKTAEQIFDEAGYVLYPECRTEEEIQEFKKFYEPGEALCTFRGGRLNYCRVWFAVKKNVKDIKRENFTEPKRQDEYGTSVISIQYTKKEPSTLSIKNRYNHTVNNPDATFSNNLDNIAPGLSDAFERQFCILSEKTKFTHNMGPYILVNGKLFRSNSEDDNIYYCANNVIIDNFEVKKFDKARYIVFENYIIDKKEKTIVKYNNTNDPKNSDDEFTKSFGKIKEVKELPKKDGREVIIIPENGEDIVLHINDNGELIEYTNNNITKVGDSFLWGFWALQKFTANHLESVGNNFLSYASELKSFVAPSLRNAGDNFLHFCNKLENLELLSLNSVGDDCLAHASRLKSFVAPNLKDAGSNFLYSGVELESLEFPNLERVGACFLVFPHKLKRFIAPKLKKVYHGFLENAQFLEEIDVSGLEEASTNCLMDAIRLKVFIAPKLRFVDTGFLTRALSLRKFIAPKLDVDAKEFLTEANNIEEYDCPTEREFIKRRLS